MHRFCGLPCELCTGAHRFKIFLLSAESDIEDAQKAFPQAEQEEGNWHFTLTGLPGVGKSVWILYAVALFFQQKQIKSVFLQQRDMPVTHQFTRFIVCAI